MSTVAVRRGLWLALIAMAAGFAAVRAAWPSLPGLSFVVPIAGVRAERIQPPSFLGTTRALRATATPELLLGPGERYALSFRYETDQVLPGALLTASLLYPTESNRPSQQHFTPLRSNQRARTRVLFDMHRAGGVHFPELRLSTEAATPVRVSEIEIRRLTSAGHWIEGAFGAGALLTVAGLLGAYWRRQRRVVEVIALVALTLGLLTLFAPHGRNGDPYWNTPTAVSWLMTGDITVDEFQWETDLPATQVGSYPHGGHWYNYFPIGMTVLSMPFTAIGLWLHHRDIDAIDGFAAQGLFALLVAAFYGLARTLRYSGHTALTLTFLLATATPNVWLGTGGTNSHTGAQLMGVLGLWLLAIARERGGPAEPTQGSSSRSVWLRPEYCVVLAAVPLALAVITRPTAFVVTACCSVYVLAQHKRQLAAFVTAGLAVAALFAAFNASVYQAPLPPYFRMGRLSLDTWWTGLAAQTLSPSRGALFFTPIYCFSLAAAWRALRTGDAFDKLLALTPVPLGLVVAALPTYTGGWGFGSRFYLDVAPFLVLLLGPTVQALDFSARPVRTWLFAILAVYSVWIHSRVFDWQVIAWNVDPRDVTLHQERVWDVRDAQFLRGL